MIYKVIPTKVFINQLKHLKKKYPSIIPDLKPITDSLTENPFQGDNLGNNCFKIRIHIRSKNRSKSSGGRLIT